MNMVCEVDLPSVSVSDCEIVEPQTFFVQKAWRQRCAVVRTAQENDSQHGSDALPVDAQRRCLGASGTELHHRQKERHYNKSDVAWSAA